MWHWRQRLKSLIPYSRFVLSGTHQWYPACIVLRGRANHFGLICFPPARYFQLKKNTRRPPRFVTLFKSCPQWYWHRLVTRIAHGQDFSRPGVITVWTRALRLLVWSLPPKYNFVEILDSWEFEGPPWGPRVRAGAGRSPPSPPPRPCRWGVLVRRPGCGGAEWPWNSGAGTTNQPYLHYHMHLYWCV